MINPNKIIRIKRLLIFVAIIVILFPCWMYLAWCFQSETPLRIIILDKTVADFPRQEHKGFNWILTHNKISKLDKKLYSINNDYYGFFPLQNKEFSIRDFENYNQTRLDSLSAQTDMIYFADNYGVYSNEWYLDTLQTEHSKIVYGGLTENEIYLAQKLKNTNKLILAEFNTFASPTNRTNRNRFEKLFDLKWSGWACRYIDQLDTILNPELPKWIVRLHKQQHGSWNFRNSGLVFVHADSRIFILENKTDLVIEVPFIHTRKEFRDYYNLPDSIHYPFWFDITFSGDSNQIVSSYKIYTTESGNAKMQKYNIPSEFPAVLRHTSTYTFYYFAGDYVDNPISNSTAYFKGIQFFDYFLYGSELNQRKKFFWNFYNPLVTKILKEYTRPK